MSKFWLFMIALIYFVFPYDLLPDFIPGIGRLDDLIIMAILYWKGYRMKPGPSTGGRTRTQSGGSSDSGQARPKQARDPYSVLGIERSATTDEIKRAYRALANRYHPDKVSHLGEEFQTLAKEKFQEIQWAYDTLMGGRA